MRYSLRTMFVVIAVVALLVFIPMHVGCTVLLWPNENIYQLSLAWDKTDCVYIQYLGPGDTPTIEFGNRFQ